MNTPLVSVIMPVYNSELFLEEAVNSILNQTYEHLELIIIDDCSTDNSWKIIEGIDSPKVRAYQNNVNQGVSFTRNRMLDLARGKYVALMDSDDISPLDRLRMQVDFLEKNPQVGLLGGSYQRFNNNTPNKLKLFSHSTIQEKNQVDINFLGAIAGGTVMLRTEIIRIHYLYFDEKLKIAEDFDFWRRIGKFCQVTNIPEVLLLYRKHGKNTMSQKNIAYQHTVCAMRKSFNDLQIYCDDLFSIDEKILSPESFFQLIDVLENFEEKNVLTQEYNQEYLFEAINNTVRWFYKANIQNLGYKTFKILNKTRYKPKLKLKLKFKLWLSQFVQR